MVSSSVDWLFRGSDEADHDHCYKGYSECIEAEMHREFRHILIPVAEDARTEQA